MYSNCYCAHPRKTFGPAPNYAIGTQFRYTREA